MVVRSTSRLDEWQHFERGQVLRPFSIALRSYDLVEAAFSEHNQSSCSRPISSFEREHIIFIATYTLQNQL